MVVAMDSNCGALAQAGHGNFTDLGASAVPSNLRSCTKISISDGRPFATCTRN